jgi:hypothetical protein
VLERLAASLPVRGAGGVIVVGDLCLLHLRVGGRGDRVGDFANAGGGGDENTRSRRLVVIECWSGTCFLLCLWSGTLGWNT